MYSLIYSCEVGDIPTDTLVIIGSPWQTEYTVTFYTDIDDYPIASVNRILHVFEHYVTPHAYPNQSYSATMTAGWRWKQEDDV